MGAGEGDGEGAFVGPGVGVLEGAAMKNGLVLDFGDGRAEEERSQCARCFAIPTITSFYGL